MAFPTTSVITQFTGIDESPLSEGGTWSGPLRAASSATQMRRVSNAAANATSGLTTSESYYNVSNFTETEVFATIPTLPGSDGDFMALVGRTEQEQAATVDMYACEYVFRTATDTVDFYRVVNAAFSASLASVSQDFIAGDKLGFSISGTGATVTLTAYRFTSGSWSQILTVGDSNAARIVTTGHIGIYAGGRNSMLGRFDDFGGGTIVTTTPLVSDTPFVILGRGSC